MKQNKHNKQRYALIGAIGVILVVAVIWALSMPAIARYRASLASRLVEQSLAQNDIKQKLSLLEQAHMIDNSSAMATEALVDFWKSRGETAKAIAAYASSSQPNYMAMGDLALGAQDYPRALKYFTLASKKQTTAESLVGEATALYNLGKTTEGCNKAAQASKLSLQSQPAREAVADCIILGDTLPDAVALDAGRPAMSGREAAYFLVDSRVYKIGESRLLDFKQKTAGDWLVLSKLASARGDISLAIARLQDGLALDNSSVELNKQAVTVYRLTADTAKQQEYASRLQQLEFTKYQ